MKKSLFNIELAAVVDAGEPFVKATYNLEGNGPLALNCYEVVQELKMRINNPHYPNVNALADQLSSLSFDSSSYAVQQWVQYASACVDPGLQYFCSKFVGPSAELSCTYSAFKSAKLFLPYKVVEMRVDIAAVDTLKSFPFLDKPAIINSLKAELAAYLTLAEDVPLNVDVLDWWKKHSTELPHWSTAVELVVLVQPSSAACERAFSLLKARFGPQQDMTLQDYIQTSVLMLQFNIR